MPVLARALLISLLSFVLAVPGAPAALPAPRTDVPAAHYATPDWMTADMVTALGIFGAPVLAPSYIPGAVSFLPSLDAYTGYYSFYWLIPGAPPTYLQVTGTVGGSIPAYSQYDRNVQLTQNASVLGYPAYHDLTPIYDLVYFAIDGVVYTVEGNNIGVSSVDLANSLTYVDVPIYEPEVPTEVPTEVPVEEPVTDPVDTGGGVSDPGADSETAAPVEDTSEDTVDTAVATEPVISVATPVYSEETTVVTIDGVDAADLTASAGAFTLTGDSSIKGAAPGAFEWVAPRTLNGRTVRFTLTDSATGEELATTRIRVEPIPDDQIPVTAEALNCPAQIPMGSYAGIEIDGSGQLLLDASDGLFPDVGPNSTFAGPSEVAGSDVLQGVIRTNRSVWVFFETFDAPEPYTTFLFLQDWTGTTLLECGIEVVLPSEAPVYPDMGPQDGTGSVGGIGIAAVGSVGTGTSVTSPDMPAVGVNPEGTPISIPSRPLEDEASPTPAEAGEAPAPTDGTSIEDPVPAGTPQP
jgi:hypothetical protein